jgi:hypothetical protein
MRCRPGRAEQGQQPPWSVASRTHVTGHSAYSWRPAEGTVAPPHRTVAAAHAGGYVVHDPCWSWTTIPRFAIACDVARIDGLRRADGVRRPRRARATACRVPLSSGDPPRFCDANEDGIEFRRHQQGTCACGTFPLCACPPVMIPRRRRRSWISEFLSNRSTLDAHSSGTLAYVRWSLA